MCGKISHTAARRRQNAEETVMIHSGVWKFAVAATVAAVFIVATSAFVSALNQFATAVH